MHTIYFQRLIQRLFFRRRDPDEPPDSCRIYGSLSLNKVCSPKLLFPISSRTTVLAMFNTG